MTSARIRAIMATVTTVVALGITGCSGSSNLPPNPSTQNAAANGPTALSEFAFIPATTMTPTASSSNGSTSGNSPITEPSTTAGSSVASQSSSSQANDSSVPATMTAPPANSSSAQATSSATQTSTSQAKPQVTVTTTVAPYKGPEWCQLDGGFDHSDQVNQQFFKLYQNGKWVATIGESPGDMPVFTVPSLITPSSTTYMRTNSDGNAQTYGAELSGYGKYGWVQALAPGGWQEIDYLGYNRTFSKSNPQGDTSPLTTPIEYAKINESTVSLTTVIGPMQEAWKNFRGTWFRFNLGNTPKCPASVN